MLSQLQQQILAFWSRQTLVERLVMIGLVVAGVVLIPVFLNWARTPSYAVAFSGLSETDAGKIIDKLNESNIPYQLRGSGTILVPSDSVYETRLQMARDGLPQGSTVGFELFSGNTLGMTEFTQRVNYQRALEGELERTISSLAPVEAVRVHIVTPERNLLGENQTPTTASVTIQENSGAYLDASQVRAITHLVASSVEGLQPENVVVVDVNGNLLAAGSVDGETSSIAQADSRRAAEMAAAQALQAKVKSILDAALGPNRSVVQAYVTLDWTEREITTQAYDTQNPSIRSSQVISETFSGSNAGLAGIPGAAANLPEGQEAAANGESNNNYTRTEQVTNYELSQTQTHELQSPGEIQRISLSVLVDGVTDPQQLNTLESVVSAAVGVDTARGDILAVESLSFDRSFYEDQASELAKGQKNDLYLKIGQGVAAFLVLVALFWYVQRLLARLRIASEQAWMPVLKPVSEMALPVPASRNQFAEGSKPSLTPPVADRVRPARPKEPEHQEQYSLPELPTAKVSPEDDRLQRMLNHLAEENPENVAEVVRTWLSDER
jgi:flagellar M-ring protein FliF